MRNLVGDKCIFCAQFLIIGAKITTTGVLFRKAERNEMAGKKRKLAFEFMRELAIADQFTINERKRLHLGIL